MSRYLVSMGAGRWQVPAILEGLKSCKVFAIDAETDPPGKSVATRSAVSDIADSNQVLSLLKRHEVEPVGVISHCNDAGLVASAVVREAYGLPGPSLIQVNSVRDKEVQYELLQDAGLPIPTFTCTQGRENVLEASARMRFPIIVKPSIGSGSRGVFLYPNRKSLEMGLIREDFSDRIRTIIQKRIQGTEFTVEIFGDGLEVSTIAVFQKIKLRGTNQLVSETLFSVSRRTVLFSALSLLAEKAVATLGLKLGPFHVEIIKDYLGRFYLIEINGRGGGFGVQDLLVPAATGVNLTDLEVSFAIGKDSNLPKPECFPAALSFLPSKAGTLVNVRGIGSVNKMAGLRCEIFHEVGYEGKPAREDGDRVGWILAKGASTRSVLKQIKLAKTKIELEFR